MSTGQDESKKVRRLGARHFDSRQSGHGLVGCGDVTICRWYALRGADTHSCRPNPKYFHHGRSVTGYNLLSCQRTGLNAITVPGTRRDSLILLAFVLEQQTESLLPTPRDVRPP
jgi:hypothetical protein